MLQPFQKLDMRTTWCPRKRCRQLKTCQYGHNCKAMTSEEARIKQAEGAADAARREALIAETEALACAERKVRFVNLEKALHTAGIDPHDLREWIERKD